MIEEFFDNKGTSAHDRFQAWRAEHQAGVFLTLQNKSGANLHGARCQHLGSGPPHFSTNDGFGSLTSNPNLCATQSELLAWAAMNAVKVRRCQHCDRDGFLAA